MAQALKQPNCPTDGWGTNLGDTQNAISFTHKEEKNPAIFNSTDGQ